ncbi:MAG TPA: GLUG motif-containing protein [Rhizomicrobium sp.]|nr:GLUG motif-containing protein [Rhizomicrobium sp.]
MAWGRPGIKGIFPGALIALTSAAPREALAAVTISSAASQNINCASGICTPTAKNAVLNVGDLENLLASGNVAVTSTGSGVQARDIRIKTALGWSSNSTLVLDAYGSIAIDDSVTVSGIAGLTLTTNDGVKDGVLSFQKKGHVMFANLSSNLTINGTAYTLENSIVALASAIASNPSGAYALAASYDASGDGTYTTVPIPTPLTGTFEGLDNAISHLSIEAATETEVGLFAEVASDGTLRDIHVPHANISNTAGDSCAGPLAGTNFGLIIGASASGTVSSENSCAGGLVGSLAGFEGEGIIMLSSGATKVSGLVAGGLVGSATGGNLLQSFATGKVSATEYAGGLVGEYSGGAIKNCYATGRAQVPRSDQATVGGMAGLIDEQAAVGSSYSSGDVKGGVGGPAWTKGGFVGAVSNAMFSNSYWDTDTSGIRNLHRGAGNVKDEAGIEGLTTVQLKSGLPSGFSPLIWGENADVNDGFPYLLANAPD